MGREVGVVEVTIAVKILKDDASVAIFNHTIRDS